MSFPLSHSTNSSLTSLSCQQKNDMHTKPAPRSTSAPPAATTSGGVPYNNGETFKENDDDEEDEYEESKSLSEMSGLLTRADAESSPPPVRHNVSFATAGDQTATTSSIVQQQQHQSTTSTFHSKTNARAQEDHTDFPEKGDVNEDDNDNDSDASSSSSSSSTDDDDDDSVVGIDERRAFNVKRNHARLAFLGLLHNKSPSRKGVKRGDKKQKGAEDSAKQENHDDDSINNDDDTRRGILLPAALLDFESSTAIDSSTAATTTSIADIQARFPHRERQIQKLAALMEVSLTAAQTRHLATTMTTTTTTAYVPAPILLTGGSGTGKTCVTLELLRHYHHQQQQQDVASNVCAAAPPPPPPPPVPLISYLDCATLDANTVDEVIRQVVYDLQQQQQYAQSRQHHHHHQQSSLRHGKGKKKRKMAPAATGAGRGPDNQNCSTKRLKSPPPSLTAESGNPVVHLEVVATGSNNTIKESSKTKESSQIWLDDEGNTEKKVESSTQHHSQQQPSRRRSLARTAKQQQHQNDYLQSKKSATIQQKMKHSPKRTSKSSSMTAQDITASSENAMSHSTAPTATWKLGRIWKRALTNNHYCGGGGGSSSPVGPLGFWVIDQAHCLFSLQISGKQQQQNHAEMPNLLAQILLLPQTLGLNLTIIVISNHLFLDQTRLNMLAEPSKSLATLAGAVQPIRFHFPAYKGISVIQSVLNQARHCHFITGNARGGTDDEDSATASLQKKVYQSFTTALIQSVYDSTTDLKEILRLGRLLWPQYIEPLQADQIDKTLQAATSRCPSSSSKNHFSGGKKDGASVEPPSSEAVEGQVLAILNQKILPQIRPFLAASLYTLSAPFASGSTAASSHHELPDLAKYLLLAGYLCQVNRPDRDKHLFSIQKNGRRRKSQATENTAAENVALGSTQQQQQQQQVVQRIPRLRSFPMERLLSVYVSVVALNQGASSSSLASANAAMSFIEQSERLQSLGNNILGQHLAYLHSTGLLYDHPPRGPADVIRLSEPRYCCSLTEDEARQVAQTLNFPLDRYLLV